MVDYVQKMQSLTGLLTASFASISAPLSSSVITHLERPQYADFMRGVSPFYHSNKKNNEKITIITKKITGNIKDVKFIDKSKSTS